MFRTFAILSALASASAFAPSSAARSSSALRMSFAEEMPGALAPLGFFDPLNISEGKSEAEMRKIREAELKHGRIAMLATIGVLVGENFNPLFNSEITGPAIFQFQQADAIFPAFWTFMLVAVGMFEGQNIITGWEQKPDAKTGVSNLKENYVNGDLGFDPLNLKPTDADAFDVMRTKELNNGRLAMIGIAGIVAQELVTGDVILNFGA